MEENLPTYHPEPDRLESDQAAAEHFAKKIRQFLQDEADKNHLLLGEREFSWEDIYRGIDDALGDFNITQPSSNYTARTLPKLLRNLIYMRAAVYCFRSAANVQARNNTQFSDQGFTVSESDKAPMYLQLAGNILQDYEQKKLEYKVQVNIDSFWGGIGSDAAYWSEGGHEDGIL